jgi:ABC-type transporter Mla subunit MlaD
LSYLSAHTLELEQHVTDVAGGAAEYLQAVQAFSQSLADKRQQAEQLLGPIKEALETLKKQADDADDTLEATMKAAESALQEVIAALDEGERDVRQAIEQATGKLDSLKETADAAGDRAGQAQEESGSALDQLADRLEEGASKVDGALGPAITLAGKLTEAVDSTQQAIKEPIENVTTTLAALGPDAESHVTDVGTRIFELMGSLPDRYEAPIADLEGMAEGLRDEFTGIAEEAGEELPQLADPIDQGRNEVLNTLAEPPEAWGTTRESVETQAEALEENQQPLPAGVAAVQEAAVQNGIEFGQ